MSTILERLSGEPPAQASVRSIRGTPRLLVNGQERFPLLAWSWELEPNVPIFRDAGIHLLHPIIGLNAAWPSRGTTDWGVFSRHFEALLRADPEAYLMPRVLLDVPGWWKQEHPEELIVCSLPTATDGMRHYRAPVRSKEGGWLWGIQTREPSMASQQWRSDMEKLYRAFLRYVEASPFRSRIIGYQVGTGIYGEWHYFISEFIPDLSSPMERRLGPLPTLMERLHTSNGLFRDPTKEHRVVEYYRRFHEELCATTLLDFARMTKEETAGRVLCGAFYSYLLENVWIQDGGHLAPEQILSSPDIDFIASPYSYQTTNIEGRPWWEHDVCDDAGNYLGRSRGVGGDAGYRVLLESLKRHGKLFFAEIDPGTFLEPVPKNPDGTGGSDVERELCMIGGIGSTTVEGTLRIIRRDLGRMFVGGNGGWLFDFGPVMAARKSWYGDERILREIRRFTGLGHRWSEYTLSSVAQIAAIYDPKSFFVTRHWRAEHPFRFGASGMDYFGYWFLDGQSRVLHRCGAPVDFLYSADLEEKDFRRYKLMIMGNLFLLSPGEVDRLRRMLEGSGATVVWLYAPGYVSPDGLDVGQMEALTGFRFSPLDQPGPMLVRATLHGPKAVTELPFGVRDVRHPRFVLHDAETLGVWTDSGRPACGIKVMDGWRSVYMGTAPLPIEVLRWLAELAGARLWSTRADIVLAAEDAALVVTGSEGRRTITLHKPLAAWGEGKPRSTLMMDAEQGDVTLFLPPFAG